MMHMEKMFRKMELYLTRPNDKMVFDHIDVLQSIDGVKEEWTRKDTEKEAKEEKNKRRAARFSAYYLKASYVLKRLRKHEDAYPFAEPVPKSVEGYYERIKNPMDLQSLESEQRTFSILLFLSPFLFMIVVF